MGFCLTTSDAKRQAVEDYACQRLNQLTHGISITFQQDRKLLETVLLTKQRRRDRRRRLLDDLRRKGVATARAKYLKSMSKTGAADMKRETATALLRAVRRTIGKEYFKLKSKTGTANTKRKLQLHDHAWRSGQQIGTTHNQSNYLIAQRALVNDRLGV